MPPWARFCRPIAVLIMAGMASVIATAPARAATASPGVTQTDVFGAEVTLTAKQTIGIKGIATWDNAFETLVDSFKTLHGYLEKNGLKPDGPAMTVYLATDDSGFQYFAAIPVAQAPPNPPQGDISLSRSPEGKALKFIHRGSYDSMDATYEAITNFLDEKRLEAKDLFIEQYVTDPRTTAEDDLVIEVFVPLK